MSEPMYGEEMTFPDSIDGFFERYGFWDKEEVYTNGSMLITRFRVEQMIEHYFAGKSCGQTKEDRDERLKPCPFCGGEAEIVHTRSGDDFVRCADKQCHARTRNYHEAESLAIDAWNERAERTCTMEPSFTEPGTLHYCQEFKCSACGEYMVLQQLGEYIADTPRYCCHCGAKVVGA